MKKERQRWLAPGLFALGLTLRLAGLLFKGTHDIDQLVLEWGASVAQNGIGQTPIVIYGFLSYVFHGFAFSLATLAPRFWWAPQKFLEIISEIGILLVLIKLLPRHRASSAIWFYWMNPFFILSGGWLGFWDGPYTLAGLIAILAMRDLPSDARRWFAVGAALAAGALFKPQALIYFIMPLGIYTLWTAALQRRLDRLLWLSAGGLAVFGVAETAYVLLGGGVTGIPRSYLIGDVMPNLCNSCISVWRPITRILQLALGQTGALYELRLPGFVSRVADRLILMSTIALVVVFGLRVASLGRLYAGEKNFEQSKTEAMLRTLGMIAIGAGVIGLFHASDPRMHAHLVVGRYSTGYLAMVSGIVAAGVVLLVGARSITTLIQRVMVVPGEIQPLRRDAPNAEGAYLEVYLILAFGALVIPQLATRAHISHTYAGLVFLIPLAMVNRSIFWPWVTMTVVHFYGYLSTYGIGNSTALPDRDISSYPEAAHRLISSIDQNSFDPLFGFQAAIGNAIRLLMPQEPVLSVLSVIQFACVIVVISELYTRFGNADRLASSAPAAD